jgi:hypothetical protein
MMLSSGTYLLRFSVSESLFDVEAGSMIEVLVRAGGRFDVTVVTSVVDLLVMSAVESEGPSLSTLRVETGVEVAWLLVACEFEKV